MQKGRYCTHQVVKLKLENSCETETRKLNVFIQQEHSSIYLHFHNRSTEDSSKNQCTQPNWDVYRPNEAESDCYIKTKDTYLKCLLQRQIYCLVAFLNLTLSVLNLIDFCWALFLRFNFYVGTPKKWRYAWPPHQKKMYSSVHASNLLSAKIPAAFCWPSWAASLDPSCKRRKIAVLLSVQVRCRAVLPVQDNQIPNICLYSDHLRDQIRLGDPIGPPPWHL